MRKWRDCPHTNAAMRHVRRNNWCDARRKSNWFENDRVAYRGRVRRRAGMFWKSSNSVFEKPMQFLGRRIVGVLYAWRTDSFEIFSDWVFKPPSLYRHLESTIHPWLWELLKNSPGDWSCLEDLMIDHHCVFSSDVNYFIVSVVKCRS